MPGRRRTVPALPSLLKRKLYKTGQTRGADDDVIFQNRVLRNSTVLIMFRSWRAGVAPRPDGPYENGSIVLLSPPEFLSLGDTDQERKRVLRDMGIPLGTHSLVFYERRADWVLMDPDERGWCVATSRIAPLGGEYVARVASTTRGNDERLNRGFTTTDSKGAGVRVYEYASSGTIELCRAQLEAIFWHADDAVQACVEFGMGEADAFARMEHAIHVASELALLDRARLRDIKALDAENHMICPLCKLELSARGFFTKVEQAEGREVHDLTVTSLNLFHIEELRVGLYNHRPYNIAWGCHHCNMVAKDAGIEETLDWMQGVLRRNNRIID